MMASRWLLAGLAVVAGNVFDSRPEGALIDERSAVLVRADGTAWLTGAARPVQPVPGVDEVVSAGRLGSQALLVRRDGSAWVSISGVPQRVSSAPRLRSVSCGGAQCLAITAEDRVVVWRGGGVFERLDGFEDVAAVAVGEGHTLTLTHAGQVWVSGHDERGQVAPEELAEGGTPRPLVGLAGAASVAAGARHSAVTLRDGSVWVWGSRMVAGLNGVELHPRATPRRLAGVVGAVQVALLEDRLFVLLDDGEVWERVADETEPRKIESPGEVVALHAGGGTVIAERADGRLWDCLSATDVSPRAIRGDASQITPSEVAASLSGTAALMVGGGDLTAGDEFVRRRLEALGLRVDLVQAGDLAGLESVALVVVSASVEAREVDAPALATLGVPVVTWERFLFTPLGLTSSRRLPSQRSTYGDTLSVVRPGHPLTAGLGGAVRVLERPSGLVGGAPGAGVQVVAVGPTGVPAVLAYEAGAGSGYRVAPARRVGLFLPASDEASLTSAGARLIDAAVRWALGAEVSEPAQDAPNARDVLLVVGSTVLSPGDVFYKSRMETLGFTVHPIVASAAQAGHAAGKVLVFVTHSAPNGDVLAKFTHVLTPVALVSTGPADDMAMARTENRGNCAGQSNQTTIVDTTHPIVGGLTGVQTLSTSPSAQNWATPSAAGRRVFMCDGVAAHTTAFTYNAGDIMEYDLPAPARRTFWGFFDPIPSTLTPTGIALFDRMIVWASNTTNQPPSVNAGPDQSGTTCEPPPHGCQSYQLAGQATDDNLPHATLSVQWSVVSGTGAVQFGSPTQASTAVLFYEVGTFVLRLTAYDGQYTTVDHVTIEVYPDGSNLAPTVHAGPDQLARLSQTITLTGSADDDGLPNPPGDLTYAWSKVSGPGAVTFGTPASSTTTASFSLRGTYVVRLSASDSVLSGYDDVVVTANRPALLVVGNLTLGPGETYLKSRIEALGFQVDVKQESQASSSDAQGRAFVWVSGTIDNNAWTGNPFAYSNVPVVVQSLGYVDDLGLTDGPRVLEPGRSTVTIGAPTHALSAGLRGTVSTSVPANYGRAVSATWAARVAYINANAGHAVIFSYEKDEVLPRLPPGCVPSECELARERRLFVGFQDDAIAGLAAKGRRLLDAAISWAGRSNVAPWVDAGAAQTAILGATGVTLPLDGHVVDDSLPVPPAQTTSTWVLVAGPGPVTLGNANQPATTVSFSVAGTYVLRLTATDGAASASSLTSVRILTAGGNGAPTVSAGPDRTLRLQASVGLQASAADDGAPGPLTYAWTKAHGPGSVVFGSPNASSTTAGFTLPGVYVLEVAVADGALASSDEVQVTVEPARTVLLVVGNVASLRGDEVYAKQELEALGFVPLVKDTLTPPVVTAADANGKALVVLSSAGSVTSVGTMFRDTTTPVLLWAALLYGPMGLTGPVLGTHYGSTLGTHVDITAAGHPLAAGLAGAPQVYNPTGWLDWGVPATGAVKVAALSGEPQKAALFAYERGASMVSGVAPARRVGLFATNAWQFTPAGAALFRAALTWAGDKPVVALLVVNSEPLSTSDEVVKARLGALGYGVVVKTGAAATGSDALGKAVVVVSNAPAAAAKFRDALTAVVTWEGSVMSAMNLVGATAGTSYGTLAGQTKISIAQQLHPLSGGLNGLGLPTTTSADTYTWGVPAAAAVKVATVFGDATRATVFGYEAGAALAAGNAVDRRVGLFLGSGSAALFTSNGQALLDAALRWAGDSDPDTDGLGTADEYALGTDPRNPDTNGDGLLDGAAVDAGISPTGLDIDGDGVLNADEIARGTDPFNRDTDGDGTNDGSDCFPLDPARQQCPGPVPGDVTPPIITLREPTNAVLLP